MTYVLARYSVDSYAGCAVASIGENIRAARVAAGLATQRELAAKLKVPQPQMSDWENDRYTPDVRTLLRIAAAIPCGVDTLLAGIDEAYDEIVIARADLARGNNEAPVTSPVPPDGVKDARPVQNPYEQPSDLGAMHVVDAVDLRSPLAIAVAITEHATALRARIDALTALADEITDRSIGEAGPGTDQAPRRGVRSRSHGERTPGRGPKR